MLVLVLVVMMAAAVLVVVVVVMLVLVLVVMMAAAAHAVLVVMVMVVMMALGCQNGLDVNQRLLNRSAVFDGGQNLLAGQLVPRRGDDGALRVVLADQADGLFDLRRVGGLRAAHDDAGGGLELILIKLAEVLQVHLALGHVHHGGAAGDFSLAGGAELGHNVDDLGELAHAGGLDDDALGMELLADLIQRIAEIAGQRAADAAGIQLGHLDARALHEAAVDAHLAVFVLQQHDLLAMEGLRDQLFDQSRLSSAQKAGNDVNFRHNGCLRCR